MIERLRIFLALPVLLLVTAGTLTARAEDLYKISGEYKVSGENAKDVAIDSAARRLFVASGNQIEVLNADTGASEGSIPQSGATGLLLVPGTKRGFAAGAQSVTMFDTETLKPLKVTKVKGSGAASLCYAEGENSVYVENESGNITSLDATTGAASRTIGMEDHLGKILCGPANQLYVASPGKNVVHVLDGRSLAELGDYPMDAGKEPYALSFDPLGRRLFVACANGWEEIIDTDSGFIFSEVSIGKGPASSLFARLPQGKSGWKAAVFVSSEDGTLSLIRMNAYISYSLGGQMTLPAKLNGIAIDSSTHRVFGAVDRSGKPGVLVLALTDQGR